MEYSQRLKAVRALASSMLEIAICDAFGGEGEEEAEGAKEWLLLTRTPNEEELLSKDPLSFIGACRLLGLNWLALRESLKGAVLFTDTDFN